MIMGSMPNLMPASTPRGVGSKVIAADAPYQPAVPAPYRSYLPLDYPSLMDIRQTGNTDTPMLVRAADPKLF